MNRESSSELTTSALEAITAAGLVAAVAVDSSRIESIVTARKVALMMNPPRITYTTHFEARCEWELWLITHSGREQSEAWDRLSDALEAIRLPLELESADPDVFTSDTGTAYPAYRATITADYRLP